MTTTAAVAAAGDAAVRKPNVPLRVAFAVYIAALAGLCWWQHRILFAWPAGIVTGNLLASAIWAPLAVIHLDRLHRRQHAEHMALLHRQHSEHLLVLCGHHKVVVTDGRPAVVPDGHAA